MLKPRDTAAIGIIGGADGSIVIFVSCKYNSTFMFIPLFLIFVILIGLIFYKRRKQQQTLK